METQTAPDCRGQCCLCCSYVQRGSLHGCSQPGRGRAERAGCLALLPPVSFFGVSTVERRAVLRFRQGSQALQGSGLQHSNSPPWVCTESLKCKPPAFVGRTLVWMQSVLCSKLLSAPLSKVRVTVLRATAPRKYPHKINKWWNVLMKTLGRLVGITVSFSFAWIALGCELSKQFFFKKKPQWSCFNFLTIWGNGLCHQRRGSVLIRKCSIVCSFSLELQSLKSWHLYGIMWYPAVPLQTSCNKKKKKRKTAGFSKGLFSKWIFQNLFLRRKWFGANRTRGWMLFASWLAQKLRERAAAWGSLSQAGPVPLLKSSTVVCGGPRW